MEFSDEEQKVLAPYFTNLEKPVFAIRNLPEVVKGALFSRYSRTSKSLRRVLYDEFIKNSEIAFEKISLEKAGEELVAVKKAEEFYDRVLVGYGDDSVAELGGAHVAVEQVSNIATKVLEDSRLGLSPLEKSTRYVYFNEKAEGKYLYYREPLLMQLDADRYEKTCDFLFDTYSRLMDPMGKYFKEKIPQGDASERAYASAIRAKVCDTIRGLLPASTLTNMGIFGNGRAFEYLLLKMYCSELQEVRQVAGSMQEELGKVIPSFVKRSNDNYGKSTQEFLKQAVKNISTLPKVEGSQTKPVVLVDFDSEALEKIASAILYEHSTADLQSIKEHVKKMNKEEKEKIISLYTSHRQNRRHKPGRAFENCTYTFSIQANYGAYRDLQRHRILTQSRQLLTTKHGFDLPKEIVNAGFEKEFKDAMDSAMDAYDFFKKHEYQAQYVVPMAFKLQWYATINLRAAFHMIELRSMQQGHPDYRRIVHEMFHEINKIHPTLAMHMKFVDFKIHELERIESEKNIDKKMQQLRQKYGGLEK